ncbi:hypothetical protein DFJ74DRAFT_716696, partial [Hyaloraphidium curvatum]
MLCCPPTHTSSRGCSRRAVCLHGEPYPRRPQQRPRAKHEREHRRRQAPQQRPIHREPEQPRPHVVLAGVGGQHIAESPQARGKRGVRSAAPLRELGGGPAGGAVQPRRACGAFVRGGDEDEVGPEHDGGVDEDEQRPRGDAARAGGGDDGGDDPAREEGGEGAAGGGEFRRSAAPARRKAGVESREGEDVDGWRGVGDRGVLEARIGIGHARSEDEIDGADLQPRRQGDQRRVAGDDGGHEDQVREQRAGQTDGHRGDKGRGPQVGCKDDQGGPERCDPAGKDRVEGVQEDVRQAHVAGEPGQPRGTILARAGQQRVLPVCHELRRFGRRTQLVPAGHGGQHRPVERRGRRRCLQREQRVPQEHPSGGEDGGGGADTQGALRVPPVGEHEGGREQRGGARDVCRKVERAQPAAEERGETRDRAIGGDGPAERWERGEVRRRVSHVGIASDAVPEDVQAERLFLLAGSETWKQRRQLGGAKGRHELCVSAVAGGNSLAT